MTTLADSLTFPPEGARHPGRHEVVEAEFARGVERIPAVVKKVRVAGGRDRAARSWEVAQALALRGIDTPEPLAVGRVGAEGWYVARRLDGAEQIRRWFLRRDDGAQPPPALPYGFEDVVAALGRLARRLHDSGVFFRDFTDGNVLVTRGADGPRLWLVDLDRARVGETPVPLLRQVPGPRAPGPEPARGRQAPSFQVLRARARASPRGLRRPGAAPPHRALGHLQGPGSALAEVTGRQRFILGKPARALRRPRPVTGSAMAKVLSFPHRADGTTSVIEEPRPDEESRARAERLKAEAEILARVVAGDTEAFEYFVRTYQRRITRFVFTLLRDSSEADCVAQDVFVKAFRALGDFKGESAFETWITRIAINTVRDRIRRRRPVVSFSELRDLDDDDGPEIPPALDPADGTSPERDLLSGDIRRRIADALVTLSPRQRSIFVMKHYEEKSIAEIGDATGLDEGTIKSHLFRAARKLRICLEDLR